jgi:hypothetical protein
LLNIAGLRERLKSGSDLYYLKFEGLKTLISTEKECLDEHLKRGVFLASSSIRLFNISNFPSIVKDELAVLQQRAAAPKTAETRITYDTVMPSCFIIPVLQSFYSP